MGDRVFTFRHLKKGYKDVEIRTLYDYVPTGRNESEIGKHLEGVIFRSFPRGRIEVLNELRQGVDCIFLDKGEMYPTDVKFKMPCHLSEYQFKFFKKNNVSIFYTTHSRQKKIGYGGVMVPHTVYKLRWLYGEMNEP